MHWSDTYYGDLYLDSTAELLTPGLSALEARVIAGLLGLGPGQRALDLACGHGRHAIPLAGHVALLAAVDRSERYLRRGARRVRDGDGRPAFVCADLRSLPFADGTFDSIYSWYASLFMWDEAGNAAALSELSRVLRRGGRALVQHANPLRLAAEPEATSRHVLADGTTVEEEADFDARSGVERAHRRLIRPDGTVLAGTSLLRYYRPDEWVPLARRAGLQLAGVTSTTGVGAGPGPLELDGEAPDLVAVLEKS